MCDCDMTVPDEFTLNRWCWTQSLASNGNVFILEIEYWWKTRIFLRIIGPVNPPKYRKYVDLFYRIVDAISIALSAQILADRVIEIEFIHFVTSPAQ